MTQTLDPTAGYSNEDAPLRGYATLVGAFATAAAGTALVARRRGARLPERIGLRDVAMAGVATYKLSRLISKDRVTSFVRAPFTRYEEDSGRGEVEEEPRGAGVRRAVGELVICPYCVGFWVASGFTAGLILAPRATRAVAAALDALAIADGLQMLDRAAKQESGAG